MTGQTYSKGVLLWIDDRFADIEPRREDLWEELFGTESPRLFRLMDLSLELAVSFEEGRRAIDELTSAHAAGAFVLSIVDLKIPQREGGEDQTRYGVEIAKELRRRNLPLFFLSSNTDASNILNQANLGTVQYYVKQRGLGPWRLPEDLSRMVLSEFRNHISWISLEEIVEAFHEDSMIITTYRNQKEAFSHFPFFGPFRDFVWRWESRQCHELPHVFVVKATVDHCDEFVQQALSLLLYQHVVQAPGTFQLYYGAADDGSYLNRLASQNVRNDNNAISILRAYPDRVPEGALRHRIHEAGRREGRTILVLPNDESCDRYSELLREHRIPVLDELPQLRHGDALARSELIHRTCALVFQRWSVDTKTGQPLPLGYLAHPELLINPIHWTVLHEATDVVQTLSDPYEITRELLRAMGNLTKREQEAIRAAVAQQKPAPYGNLLRIGDAILNKPLVQPRVPVWMERALDEWLNTSWHFPYGLSKQFTQLEVVDAVPAGTVEESGLGEAKSVWRCRHWQSWEDSCFETLVGMLDEFRGYLAEADAPPAARSRRADLARVDRFVGSLGGTDFLGKRAEINWESLESLRWPHHRYPLPAAVNRRLKQHGRYLWIQPEGLDLASALPTGRSRYRMLASIVEQYSSVLAWGCEIAGRLPRGWSESVAYLTDVVCSHRVADEWKHHPLEMWHMLLGLLRNATPLMYVVSQLLRNKPPGEAKSTLSKVKGYGEILGRIRGTLARRHGSFLRPRWTTAGIAESLAAFEHEAALAQMAGTRSDEVDEALWALLRRVASTRFSSDRCAEQLAELWQTWAGDEELAMFADGKGWYTEDLAKRGGERSQVPIASLLSVRSDSLWHLMDAATLLAHLTHRYRYADGYHFLAVVNDLRCIGKDTRPQVPLAKIETALELFVASLEGLLAQLSWFLEVSGWPDQAQKIAPPGMTLEVPADFKPPNLDALREVMRVCELADGYAVFTLGIPGEGRVNELSFHVGDHARLLADRAALAKAS